MQLSWASQLLLFSVRCYLYVSEGWKVLKGIQLCKAIRGTCPGLKSSKICDFILA